MSDLIQVVPNEVVLYRRTRSARWQARIKLPDKTWRRVSTHEHDSNKAAKAALKLYYETEFKHEHKLPQNTRKFGHVADTVAEALRAELDAGNGKAVYASYISAIRLYLKPFFGKYNIDSINQQLLKRFDSWRKERMGKEPVASTITNHNSALNRVFDYALERGWVTRTVVPKLSNKGKKGDTRPAFTAEEYRTLVRELSTWCKQGHSAKTRMIRELLRDYVLVLANTGIRHGTEAMNLKWRNIEWTRKDGQPYLLMTVNGKTGTRSIIARHNTQKYLKRIQQRFAELAEYDFDTLLKKRIDLHVFRLADGTRTNHLNQSFRQFLRATGLAVGAQDDKERTLYSLRHTYATLAIKDGIDSHVLAKQMGTSVAMIEQHYSKITPQLMADKFGGKRYDQFKATKKK